VLSIVTKIDLECYGDGVRMGLIYIFHYRLTLLELMATTAFNLAVWTVQWLRSYNACMVTCSDNA